MQNDLLSCDECGAELPEMTDGIVVCAHCGVEHLSSTGEFGAITERTLPTDRASHAGEDAARIPMSEEAILELLRRHLGASGAAFVAPNIPVRKEEAARRAHIVHLPGTEKILALYDSTMLGSGDEGFVVTTRRVCWKNMNGPACSIQWRDLNPERLWVDGGRLALEDDELRVADEDVLEACADAFHVLALSAKPVQSGHMAVALPVDLTTNAVETPSAWFMRAADPISRRPPLTTSIAVEAKKTPAPLASYLGYSEKATPSAKAPGHYCWHCHTPLHATTPQCGYCGAAPKKHGWRKAS